MSFQLSYLFTNHMILQRDKRIAVFGTGKTGSKITVSLLDDNEEVVTDIIQKYADEYIWRCRRCLKLQR